MIITATLHAISAFFFKLALTFSHMHFVSAVVIPDPHVIFNHFKYAEMFKVTRPFLNWSPI